MGCAWTPPSASMTAPTDHLVTALTRAARAAAAEAGRSDPGGGRERAAARRSWCGRPQRAARGSTPSTTRTFTTARWWRPPAATRATTANTTAPRRSCCRRSSTASCSRASATTGRSSGAASPTRGLAPAHIVGFLENHDQVANSATGQRLWQLTSPGRHRALTTLLAVRPLDPVPVPGRRMELRRGRSSTSPTTTPELAALVRKGPGRVPVPVRQLPSPTAQDGADRSRERADVRGVPTGLGRAVAARARPGPGAAPGPDRTCASQDPVLAAQGRRAGVHIDGAVLGYECLLVRYFADDGDDRLLIVNLGRELQLRPAPEPLLAPPEGGRWQLRFSSNDRRYGGPGACPPESEDAGMDHRRTGGLPAGGRAGRRPWQLLNGSGGGAVRPAGLDAAHRP